MVLYLKVEDGRIPSAKYQTYGCGPTIAAGSMLDGDDRGMDDRRNAAN